MEWDGVDPTPAHRVAYAEAEARPFWWRASGPARAEWAGAGEADLCVVGAGFTGLWAAIQAKRRTPEREIVVLEAEAVGFGASGRNGGFVSSSLTHGIENGLAKFEAELGRLEQLGTQNYEGFKADLDELGIDCAFEETGELTFALEPHQVPELEASAELLRRFGHEADVLGAEAARELVASPTYRGALRERTGVAVLDPGALVRGLAAAAERLGVRIFERSPVRGVTSAGAGLELATPGGPLTARAAIDATGAYGNLTRRVRHYVMPIYDYALVTEPLSVAQMESIGWRGREGLTDMGNRFHYYRRIGEGRILWGGYDAVYRFGGPVGPSLDQDDATFARLSQHFFLTFPQLEGVRFSHRWGGAIDTCSRFAPFFGTSHGGRLAFAAGYTGLGVCATRFGATVALDLLEDGGSDLTRLRYVRRRPLPYPPEPLRFPLVQLTRRQLAAADRSGRRGWWLRLLDRLGVGFDS
ncbi:MAG: FAD-dependent oxidoreductase [Actinobacteria bacterium]|nr:FAD-dependent oxidoreductase [Actinomycetota bacterium]